VQNDIDEGVRAGVTGTPTFFINGRLIAGAQPVERFAALIDEELKRTQ
jgi:protein-disulfide isomerase